MPILSRRRKLIRLVLHIYNPHVILTMDADTRNVMESEAKPAETTNTKAKPGETWKKNETHEIPEKYVYSCCFITNSNETISQ